MSKGIQIRIPEPCHESWQNMLPQEQGRFCGSCQKTIVDFSTMTDNELLQYFSSGNHHMCGRFSKDQLNKDIKPVEIKKGFSWAYIWNVIMATFMIVESSAQVKPVKKTKPEVQLPDTLPTMGTFEVAVKDDPYIKEIEGIVVDDKNVPLQGASVYLKDKSTGTITDSSGKFSLMLYKKAPLELVFSYVGFDPKTVLIDSSTNYQHLKIGLSPVEYGDIFMGVVAVKYVKKKKKVINEWKPAKAKNDIKVYPNPVVRGNTIQANVSLKQSGNYILNVINVHGAVMTTQKLVMATKEQKITVPTQVGWSPGIYWMRISAPGEKNVYQCKVAIQ